MNVYSHLIVYPSTYVDLILHRCQRRNRDDGANGLRVEIRFSFATQYHRRGTRSPERDIHLNTTPGCRGVDAGGYPPDVALHDPPLRTSEHHNRNCAALQILLRRHILIGRQEQFKSGLLSRFEQLTVGQLVPTGFFGFRDGVAFEERISGAGVP
jgi:hypothetical protein